MKEGRGELSLSEWAAPVGLYKEKSDLNIRHCTHELQLIAAEKIRVEMSKGKVSFDKISVGEVDYHGDVHTALSNGVCHVRSG